MKKILNNKLIMIVEGLIIILLLICIFNKKISKIEKIYIDNVSSNIMPYFYAIDLDSTSLDKYIYYTLEYNYNEYNKISMKTEEIVDFIKNKFKIKIDSEDIIDIGITPIMAEKNIVYSSEIDEYSINSVKKSYKEIASIPITTYKIKKIKKLNNKKYKVIYEKYIIENPYELLNYYNDLNMDKNNYDTSDISSYLSGEKSVKVLNKYLNKDVLNNIGKKDKNIKVTYIIENDKFLISNIE